MKNNINPNSILDKISFGWNLGNFLDAHDKRFCWMDTKCKSIQYVVNLWNNPTFNFDCFDALKNSGINCVRIPITWCNFIDIYKNDITISNEFITYLKTIIDTAIKRDFIVIIDMHHDDQTWLKISCSRKEFGKICKRYKKLWQTIAYLFKDYNQNLIFEGMNEIIDRSDPDKYDWVGKDKKFFKRLNLLHKIFIKSVRRFSLNNRQRTLMISTYGAQIHKIALSNFKMVKDKNTIVDLHFYSRHTDVEYYEKTFKYIKQFFIDKNIPIILGEIGTKKDCANDLAVLETYTNYLKNLNIKYLLWDNGKSRKFIDRETGKINNIFLK